MLLFLMMLFAQLERDKKRGRAKETELKLKWAIEHIIKIDILIAFVVECCFFAQPSTIWVHQWVLLLILLTCIIVISISMHRISCFVSNETRKSLSQTHTKTNWAKQQINQIEIYSENENKKRKYKCN